MYIFSGVIYQMYLMAHTFKYKMNKYTGYIFSLNRHLWSLWWTEDWKIYSLYFLFIYLFIYLFQLQHVFWYLLWNLLIKRILDFFGNCIFGENVSHSVFKIKSVAYSSQGSHTGQLDFSNWLTDGSTTG